MDLKTKIIVALIGSAGFCIALINWLRGRLAIKKQVSKSTVSVSLEADTDRTAPNEPAGPSSGPPPFSLLKGFGIMTVVIVVIMAIAYFFLHDRLMGKPSKSEAPTAIETKADPCAACKPLEVSISRMDEQDNFLWSGPCTGSTDCSACAVKECKASSNDDALKICRCK